MPQPPRAGVADCDRFADQGRGAFAIDLRFYGKAKPTLN